MDNNPVKQFMFNYKDIISDEIALSGLEGVCIDQLWKLVERRISCAITEKMKIRFWNYIVKCNNITLYLLPEPMPCYELQDRFKIVDEVSGNMVEPVECLDGPFEYCPVENEYGSCKYYQVRVLFPTENQSVLTYDRAVAEYGNQLLMVASLEKRWNALAPHLPITILSHLSGTHYCMLELIGKARENGQATVGNSNLLKILPDPKFLFYKRNFLEKLDLIKLHIFTQIRDGRGQKTSLLRLKRFHLPPILTVPTTGRIYETIKYLKAQPDYSQRTEHEMIKQFIPPKLMKKVHKTSRHFGFTEKSVSVLKKKGKKYKCDTQAIVNKRFIYLSPQSGDESANSDEEEAKEPLECQYKVKVGLQRQAYNQFLAAGLKGLTRNELSQVLGVEFNTSRTICKVFKKLNIVREFMEDRGKQRISRYIAVMATREMDEKYEAEMKQFLQYVNQNKSENADNTASKDNSSDEEIPLKKIKLAENNDIHSSIIDCDNFEEHVTEVKSLDGIENPDTIGTLLGSKKTPTLRQLRFANGILKVIQKKQVVTGIQTLSNFVGKEINEPPMDAKACRIIIQKLVLEKQLKIFKMRRPVFDNEYVTLFCSRNVKPSDPIIRTKYNELTTRATNNKKLQTKKTVRHDTTRPLSQFTYPRYLRIQKLHQLICKLVLFGGFQQKSTKLDLPEGFCSLNDILPEFTVEFALGNICNYTLTDIPASAITDDLLPLKLRDSPKEIFKMFLLSPSLQLSIRTNLRILSILGLIQLVKETTSSYADNIILSYVFYVNRHPKIIDTTGDWPRKVDDIKRLEKSFRFETYEDVEDYWRFVHAISVKTTIVLPERPRKRLDPQIRSMNEVKTLDNGERFGDGNGACGFDSTFYMEIPRLWTRYNFKEKKKVQIKKKPTVTIPKIEIKKKTIPSKRKKRAIVLPPGISKPVLKIRRKRVQNENALQWTKEDDNIVTYCKAAMAIISPVIHQGSLRLRNFVCRDILSIRDPKKLGTDCHKRALFLESNTPLSHEKDYIINELKSHADIMQHYENLMKKMRLRFMGSEAKIMLEGRIPVFELVWYITQLVKSKHYKRCHPCIASTIEEFHQNYTITTFCTEAELNTYKTPDDYDTVISTIKEAIMIAVIASHQTDLKPDIATKLYRMFSLYSEPNLRLATEQLRKCSAIAAKEKNLNGHLHKFNMQDMLQACYKVSAINQRRLANRLNGEFCVQITEYLDTDLSATSLNGCPGLNCLINELLACNVFDLISLTVPVVESPVPVMDEQLTDVDFKLTLKAGTCGLRGKNNSLRKLSDYLMDMEVENFSVPNNANVTIVDSKKLKSMDKIVSHLKIKLEKGATFQELKEVTGYKYDDLKAKLTHLESKCIIKRVGFFENIIVLTDHLEQWTVKIGNSRIVPTIWVTIDNKIRHDVFLNWANIMMNKIFEYPGSTITYLASETITARNTQDVCVFLRDCKCIRMNVLTYPEPSIFSDDYEIPEIIDYNEYESMDKIVVFPEKDALTRYSYLKKMWSEKYISTNMDVSEESIS